MVAASQFPIITVLGTKNNLVSLVTCISYDRTCFMLLWIHAAAQIASYPDFQELLSEGWYHCVPFALAYEVFFYVHFLGIGIFLVGGYFHTKGAHGSYWIWPSFVFWAFDRLVRAVRLVVFNHSYFGFKSGSGTMDATTELLSEDVVRLRLRRPISLSPGQSRINYALSINAAIRSAPFYYCEFRFSLLSTPSAEDQSSGEVLGSSVPFWKELVFFINVQEGFTKKLKEVAAKKETVKVFVDGPYGPSPDLGGSGGLAYLPGVPQHYRVYAYAKGKALAHAWYSFGQFAGLCIQWIEEALIKAVQLAPPSLTVSIRIFITDSSSTTQSDPSREDNSSISSSTEKKGGPQHVIIKRNSLSSLFLSLRGVKMETGRPNLDALLKEEVNVTSGRISVSVCGSQGIARAVRHALRFPVSGPFSILSGGPSVTLHVESFGYA
ncbi:hypothetical protein BDR07DRAFT_1382138 [Suillus spraguei]|nr:hypothetical protein BDR07DRAFT_1382138 [Suillus spraguei]